MKTLIIIVICLLILSQVTGYLARRYYLVCSSAHVMVAHPVPGPKYWYCAFGEK